jgi:hypothetical protein
VIQSTPRSSRRVLPLVLSIELVTAGWWRWPSTTAPIETRFATLTVE